jgi:plastocyanin
MMRRRPVTIVLGAAALGIAACGGGEEEEAPAPAETAPPAARSAVNVEMSEFKFTPASVTVDRGGTLDVSNAGAITHNLTIERGPDAKTDTEDLAATSTFGKGESEQLEVDVARGTYVLVCTVPGHRGAGMVGKITVR